MNRQQFNKKISECHSGSQAHQVCNEYIEHLENKLKATKIFDNKEIGQTSKVFLISSIVFDELQRNNPEKVYCGMSFCEGFRSGMRFMEDPVK